MMYVSQTPHLRVRRLLIFLSILQLPYSLFFDIINYIRLKGYGVPLPPISHKIKLPHHLVRFIPAIVMCVLFGAVFAALHFSSYFARFSAASPSPEQSAGPSPSPAVFSLHASAGKPSGSRFSRLPGLDSDIGGGAAHYFDTVGYSFTDGHGTPIYDYVYGGAIPESAAVSDDYFSDAAFIGNSIMEGFMLYSGLTTAHVYAKKSINVNNILTKEVISSSSGSITIMNALASGEYSKVYILLGINEISLDPDVFCSLYSSVIDKVREIQPGADVYIQSLTPVTREQSENGSNFNKTRVCDYNEHLARLAVQTGAHYVDIYSAIADEEGYLPSDGSFDGIHPYREYYEMWRDYLKTHTVISVK